MFTRPNFYRLAAVCGLAIGLFVVNPSSAGAGRPDACQGARDDVGCECPEFDLSGDFAQECEPEEETTTTTTTEPPVVEETTTTGVPAVVEPETLAPPTTTTAAPSPAPTPSVGGTQVSVTG